ncbi:HAD superfamily, subfamily IIIB (acid phosphatase) [mine drainage metagenome]|uniref:HAD superfamily, subfamily IIIB (Acid phosphatase) n=1 Tax=mine drainage metagenome TaxID=410659 RepID=A0A1J5TR15_9ZZZZ
METHRNGRNLPHHPDCDACRGCVVAMCLALADCASAPPQASPLNLAQARASVSAYCDSGAYDRDVADVAAQVGRWLEERAARRRPGERLAAVFDVDETLLSNAPLIRRLEYAYAPREWERWFSDADAPVIEPVREVYELAGRLGIATMLVTGRRDPAERAATELNLRRRGLDRHEHLAMAPAGQPRGEMAAFKTSIRRAFEGVGYVIVANVGDQHSDLRGGHAERTFKLPDPFYLVE